MNENGTRAVILMNLGSPDSTSIPDVRKYLMEFLMDGRVIDYPYILRSILVGGLIVPFRAARSAKAYQSIWTKEGSPLIVNTKQLQAAVQPDVIESVHVAMRYGNPGMKETYKTIVEQHPAVNEVLIIPMYPHYAMSSYETAVEYAKQIHKKYKFPFTIKFIKPFFDQEDYIHALTESIRPFVQQPFDHFLFSYHGIPERHVLKSDPTKSHCLQSPDCCEAHSIAHSTCYRHQCLRTSSLVAEKLQLKPGKYSFAFQSRLGRSEWLKPYSVVRLEEMPAEGIKKLVMVCPAFVSDCLETLEEIAEEGRDVFLKAGGEQFTLIPCLNVHPLWVATLSRWIRETAGADQSMIYS
ncbi:MAG TPA: ferrochelatase [Flavitalea sp.]|nr:ferrochelatase [Flavitalea sp.]